MSLYSLHGLIIEIRYEGGGIEPEIADLLAPFPLMRLEHASVAPEIVFEITTSPVIRQIPSEAAKHTLCYGLSILQYGDQILISDGKSAFDVGPGGKSGTMYVHPSFCDKPLRARHDFFLLSFIYLLSSHNYYDLHAAGVRKNGTGYLLLGESGSGKSTLAFSLVRQGWRYLSDDALLIRPSEAGIEALSFRKSFFVDPALAVHFPEIRFHLREPSTQDRGKQIFDPDAIYQGRFTPACIPRHLVFVSIAPEEKSTFLMIDHTSALTKLMKQSASLFLNRRDPQSHLEALKGLVQQSTSYQLLAGRDLYEEPSKISDILSEAVGTGCRG